VANTAAGQCSQIVAFEAATASDSCPGVTVSCIPTNGSVFLKGTNTVTCTATDAAGNIVNCNFTVTVNDTEPPTITCPTDIVTNTAAGTCSQVVGFVPVVNDNCPDVTFVCAPASGSTFAQGATPVTCTATDASGNTTNCIFNVTVNDTEPPAITCPANVVTNTAPGGCEQVLEFAAPIVTDGCPGATFICAPASGSTFTKGTTTVTCTATDASGNTNACTFTVTINDTELPAITCPIDIVTNTAPGACSQLVSFEATATDNCPGVSVSCTPTNGAMFLKGVTIVACTATDASGNTNNCSFSVTVNDTEPPIIACSADITTNTAPESASQVVTYTVDVTDNCPGASVVCTPPSGSTFPAGAVTVTCTATDAAGNTDSSCSFTVTVAQELIANPDTLGVLANHSVSVLTEKLLANDTAASGGTLTLTDVSATSTNGGTVVLSGDSVTYTPVPGFIGTDLFTYTITDQVGTTNGSVLVIVASEADPAANLIGNVIVDQDGAHMRFAGIPDFTYAVQRSTDSVTWTTLDGSITAPVNGLMEFIDPTPPSGPLFYRTIRP
jgi:hypothetical protein